MQMQAKVPVSQRKGALEARLLELGARLDAIGTELDSHQNPDWADLAVEREGDEVLEATGIAGQQEISRIRAALHRIGAGTYGLCTTCESEIGEDRLNALPFTPFCRSCAP